MINYKDKHEYEGFKLVSLELKDNKLMGKSSLSYNFIEPEDKQTEIYTTVLIGVNGTGKSNLFRIIIELFKELYDLSINGQRSYNVDGKFNLKFSLHGDIFEYRNMNPKSSLLNIEPVLSYNEKRQAYLYKNGEKIEFIQAQIPIAIVANSIMLNDKGSPKN